MSAAAPFSAGGADRAGGRGRHVSIFLHTYPRFGTQKAVILDRFFKSRESVTNQEVCHHFRTRCRNLLAARDTDVGPGTRPTAVGPARDARSRGRGAGPGLRQSIKRDGPKSGGAGGVTPPA